MGPGDATKTAAALIILVLTLVLISRDYWPWLPTGRACGAMLGATLMVVCQVVSPEQAREAVDLEMLAVLFGLSAMVHYMEREGFFELVAEPLLRLCRTPLALLSGVSFCSFISAAIFMNDPTCLFLTPFVSQVVTARGLHPAPFLIALATSANIGATITPIGSPQNMIIASNGRLSFLDFLLPLGPVAVLAWMVNLAVVSLVFWRELFPAKLAIKESVPGEGVQRDTAIEEGSLQQREQQEQHQEEQEEQQDTPSCCRRVAPRLKLLAFAAVILGVFCASFALHLSLAWSCLLGVSMMTVLDRRSPDEMLRAQDGSLLLLFSGLFVVMRGVSETGLPNLLWKLIMNGVTEEGKAADLSQFSVLVVFVFVVLIGSNVMSNVPLVLLLCPEIPGFAKHTRMAWLVLSWVSTVAGNLTLIGSVANLIVAEKARQEYRLRFWEFTRVSAPSTLLIIPMTLPVLCALGTALQ